MNWESILAEALGAFQSGSLTFTIGTFSIVADGVAGAPARLTLGAAIEAAERVFLGQAGELTIGDVQITITEVGSATPLATTASLALASEIAKVVTPTKPATAAKPAPPTAGKITTEPIPAQAGV